MSTKPFYLSTRLEKTLQLARGKQSTKYGSYFSWRGNNNARKTLMFTLFLKIFARQTLLFARRKRVLSMNETKLNSTSESIIICSISLFESNFEIMELILRAERVVLKVSLSTVRPTRAVNDRIYRVRNDKCFPSPSPPSFCPFLHRFERKWKCETFIFTFCAKTHGLPPLIKSNIFCWRHFSDILRMWIFKYFWHFHVVPPVHKPGNCHDGIGSMEAFLFMKDHL